MKTRIAHDKGRFRAMGRLLPCQVRNEQKQSCVDANRLFYVPCILRFHFFFFFYSLLSFLLLRSLSDSTAIVLSFKEEKGVIKTPQNSAVLLRFKRN